MVLVGRRVVSGIQRLFDCLICVAHTLFYQRTSLVYYDQCAGGYTLSYCVRFFFPLSLDKKPRVSRLQTIIVLLEIREFVKKRTQTNRTIVTLGASTVFIHSTRLSRLVSVGVKQYQYTRKPSAPPLLFYDEFYMWKVSNRLF